jgi:flagellar motor switch protein FliN
MTAQPMPAETPLEKPTLLERSEAELNKAIEELRSIPGRAPVAAGYGSDTMLMNIPVEVQLVIGSCEMTVAELMSIGEGSTVPLDRRLGEPADIVVNGIKIARGEIVVMPDDPSRFGFKISEILK